VRTVLHVSPHPDDEALGAPATLLLLRAAGWTVVNVLVGLGRPVDHARRRGEATDAAGRAGFELVVPDEPFAIGSGDDLGVVEPRICGWLRQLIAARRPAVVVSPWEHDVHPGHEVVARAVSGALATTAAPPTWLAWGLWADLPEPTVYVPFDDAILERARHLLDAYAGELARNDYARLLTARATAHAVLGSERVFGFGRAPASPLPYAELLVERTWVDGAWRTAEPRVLDPAGYDPSIIVG
jgi:LmbE family N-acetylglucosaminyl deacetylase